MRYKLEYAPVWLLVRALGALPRPLARSAGIILAFLVYLFYPKLRRVGQRNLKLAFPQMSPAERSRILRGVFRTLGRQLADFCQLPRLTKENVSTMAVYEGFENFAAARDRRKGVLFLTAHLGGWELGSFVHSLHGNLLRIVVRDLDNPYIDRLVRRYRTLHGNQTLDNRDFVRGLLAALRAGETIGILMDTNMTPPQGVFVDFFGVPACTASGLARVALKTGAAVVPAFTVWDREARKYRISFEPALKLADSGNPEQDAVANTALFSQVIESWVRRYPEQWLWIHRRWKTRPPGEPPLYA